MIRTTPGRATLFRTAVALGLLAAPALHAGRPNVVLIMTDDLGTGWFPFHADRLKAEDIEPEIVAAYEQRRGQMGNVDLERHLQAARTAMPFLDSLARQGTYFDNAFATASLCGPSRAGLLTGTFQQDWGAFWNKDVDDHGIPTDRVVLAEPLHAAGYATAMIGKWHVAKKDPSIIEQVWTETLGESLPIPRGYKGRWRELQPLLAPLGYETSSNPGQHPLDRGFDYYFGFNNHDSEYFEAEDLWENRQRVPKRPAGEFLTDMLSDKASDFIRSSVEADKPFFIYYAPLTAHGPLDPPPAQYSSRFDTGHKFSNEYAGHLLALDEGIRRIFATLEATGQLDNTLFIFTSDNGCTLYNVPPYNAPNRGGKGTGWLGGLNVPLVVWGKGVQQYQASQELVSLADIMPTILEKAGVEVPAGIAGRSLLPYLTGAAAKTPRDTISSASIHSSRWSYFHDGKGENNTRDGELAPLYAWHFDGQHLLMRITPTRPGLYQSLPEGLPGQTLLYDIRADRRQLHDIAAQHPERVREMDSALRSWLGELADPLSSQKEDFRLLQQPAETAPVAAELRNSL